MVKKMQCQNLCNAFLSSFTVIIISLLLLVHPAGLLKKVQVISLLFMCWGEPIHTFFMFNARFKNMKFNH